LTNKPFYVIINTERKRKEIHTMTRQEIIKEITRLKRIVENNEKWMREHIGMNYTVNLQTEITRNEIKRLEAMV
jgi:hypothetical protein